MSDYRFDPLWLRLNFLSSGTGEQFRRLVEAETGWPEEKVGEVMAEYRKFLFLALRAGHAVLPPPMINRVWTLHVDNAVNYWEALGELITERPVASVGGVPEETGAFERTLASYHRIFEREAPAEIWVSQDSRRGVAGVWRKAARLLRGSE